MVWSEKQRKAHEESYEVNREAYISGKNKNANIQSIRDNRRRCVTLVRLVSDDPITSRNIGDTLTEIRGAIPNLYFQEISHFTLDCHRYKTEDKLPEDLNHRELQAQQNLVISPEELTLYNALLREEIRKEPRYFVEISGISISGDGLIAQVWYDNIKMNDFLQRLGDRVRTEVPSIDFIWGMVKGKVPLRVVNLTRFTGDENKENVLRYVDQNRKKTFGQFEMKTIHLLFSDHYIQKRNTLQLGVYNFADWK